MTKKIISLVLAVIALLSVSAISFTCFAECDHTYQLSETIPCECQSNGYDVYICTKCGNKDYRNIVVAQGHIDEDDDGTCDVCDEILPGTFFKRMINALLEFLKSILGIK